MPHRERERDFSTRADLVPARRVARSSRSLLLTAGFEDVSVDVHTGIFTGATMLSPLAGLVEAAHSRGAVSREHADRWIAEQRARAEDDRLFLALPILVTTGTNPH
ncbi:hypothetical protein [Streptomyces sp. NPDC087437]|uniref:hypothetical protein n=1 Tax=Streptomyces sp. NPDC087437 TaxID=3365789 RepID=UPI003805F859